MKRYTRSIDIKLTGVALDYVDENLYHGHIITVDCNNVTDDAE